MQTVNDRILDASKNCGASNDPSSLHSLLQVSTAAQGRSGLRLEAQQAAVKAFLQGRDHTLVESFVEVESGRNSERPRLGEALALARKLKATLVIAKLDRLARSVSFIANLMDAGVEFVACDMAAANRLTLHIMAAVGEAEARMISNSKTIRF